MTDGRRDRGRKAEQRGRRSEVWAAALLMLKGYRILGWRVRTYLGGIDLVARAPDGAGRFVEGKARPPGLAAAEAGGAPTAIGSRRMVAARAFANGRLARAPAARTRLWAMAATDSHAAFAAKTPDGM